MIRALLSMPFFWISFGVLTATQAVCVPLLLRNPGARPGLLGAVVFALLTIGEAFANVGAIVEGEALVFP